ncbi:hypothetical protein COB80_00540 [Candidatus Kaiserbacteria bacterium]|nr:MAG: hypothetical protein COB80_00540 [Candidatus Kaiserbacteria bacterium]
MTYIHVALFKWKIGTSDKEVRHSLDLVRDVRDRVNGISEIFCGENTSKWAQGYTHIVVVIGATQQAIDEYRSDEVHVEAAKLIEAMELDGIGVDFTD